MWADNDSDDERPGFGGGKKKSDFTAPIGFVSGGIKQGDKTFKQGEEVYCDNSYMLAYFLSLHSLQIFHKLKNLLTV
jgi:hypothetical protein